VGETSDVVCNQSVHNYSDWIPDYKSW